MVNENPRRHTPNRKNSQTNKRHTNEPSEQSVNDVPRVVVGRLKEAGLSTERFINLKEGRKQSYDHTQRVPGAVTGNYGIYCGQGLLGVDIDDPDAWADTPSTENLPVTFTVSTPHGGQHRYFRMAAEIPWLIGARTGGSLNLSPPWGDLYASKYLVGPGSELSDCGKSGCKACSPYDPGRYEITADRPIATVSREDLVVLLQSDSGSVDTDQTSIVEYSDDVPPYQTLVTTPSVPNPRNGSSTFQLQLGEEIPSELDEWMLWAILREQTHVLSGQGARVDDLIDQAESNGIDCFRVCEIVRSWLRNGDVRRLSDPNRIDPQRKGWES
ncbi:bifunctional DNA primase/polymerase [Natrialbaceae archaeon A-CW1-1]